MRTNNHHAALVCTLKQAFFLFSLFLLPIQATAETSEQHLFIQQRLEHLHFGTEKNTRSDNLYAADLVLDLYQANQFQLLWTRQDNIDQLLAAIRECTQEGLTPDDYHLQAIITSGDILKMDSSFGRQVEYDLLLSDALILLSNHKSYGKVKEPLSLAMPAARTFLPAALYLDSIKSGTLRKTLENLSPDDQVYADLKYALEKYRKIAGGGGWQSVPSGPSLKLGMHDDRIIALRTRLIITGELEQFGSDPSLFDTDLSIAIKSFQTQHYMKADGIVGKTTLVEMNRSVAERISEIRVDLERTRWVFHNLPSSYLIVDIAGFVVKYYEKSILAWSSKVIVGRPGHQTPILRSAVTSLVLNPTWTIPTSIAKKEIIPEIVKDPYYLVKARLRVFSSNSDEIDPSTIDWKQYRDKTFPYTLCQDPGKNNSLGLIKFIFSNSYQVYLHDTPGKMLFGRTKRAFSHGCIRTQNPLELGKRLISNDIGNPINSANFDQILASGKTTTLPLIQPLPIFLLYWTTSIHNHEVWFKPDLYSHNQDVQVALDGPPSPLEQRTIPVPETDGRLTVRKFKQTNIN